jgi:phage-related protein
MADKPLAWLGSSRADVRGFAPDARRLAGYELRQVQRGMEPSDWKPMRSVGPGVAEIRIHLGGEFRVLYLAKFEEAIYVLHVFQKRTRRTPQLALAIARARLRQLRRKREHQRGDR